MDKKIITISHSNPQSELPWPIPWNYVESDHGCTSRLYFDNVTLTLLNVTFSVTETYQHNNKCDCSKTNGYKRSLCFYNKISL